MKFDFEVELGKITGAKCSVYIVVRVEGISGLADVEILLGGSEFV